MGPNGANGAGNGAASSSPAGPAGFSGPSNGGNADFPDIGPTEVAYTPGGDIGEAYDQMLADDVQGEEPSEPSAPPEPTYPQPVQPGQPRQPAAAAPKPGLQFQHQPSLRQQTGQPPASAPVSAPAPPAAPAAPAQRSAEEVQAERARMDPFGVQAELLDHGQEQYINALAQNVYAVTPEDIEGFLSGDGTKISQALAKVHVNATGSILRVISQQLPMQFANMMQYHQKAQDRETSFWNANKFLDKTKHSAFVRPAATAFRAANPNASEDEVNRMVGLMVASMAGVQVPPQGHTSPVGVPGNPAVPRTPGPIVRRVASPGFSPAGTQPTGQQSPVVSNQWDQLAEVLQADANGLFDNSGL